MRNPFVPRDVELIASGSLLFSGSLLLADISGFTELSERLAQHGKRGTEDLTDVLNSYFDSAFDVIRKSGGTVISSAGDSVLARFPPEKDAGECARQMMGAVGGFQRVSTVAGSCSLRTKVVVGSGQWLQFVVGDRESAHLFLAGELIKSIARGENRACSGDIVTLDCDEELTPGEYELPDFSETSFLGPGTQRPYGEHRSVAALFLNIEGYDESAPRFDLLQGLYLDVAEVARRLGGTIQLVDNVSETGSKIFILFGAPFSSGNDVSNAVEAALELRRALAVYEEIGLSVGLNEGYAFAGAIGNDWSKQYTVIGDVVNTAARLASTAESGSIAVSESVYRIAGDNFDFRELEYARVKGKREDLKRFEPLRRIRSLRTEQGFVGRREELNLLTEVIGRGSGVVEISGPAGIGKTCLLAELSHRLSDNGFSVMYGSRSEHGRANDLLSSLLANSSGLRDDDTRKTKREKVHRYLEGLGDDAEQSIARREVFFARMLFNLDFPDSSYDALPPKLRKENLLDGMCGVIRAQPNPVCVFLDDLQNAEEEELSDLSYLAKVLLRETARHTVLVLSRRPDDRPIPLEEGTPLYRMSLSGLEESDSEQLMQRILRGKPLDGELEATIKSRAGGNPFYLVQFLLYLTEKGLIREGVESWERTDDYSDEELPENVFSMIMSRIDRLAERAKECLRVGSVVGLRFTEEILRKVLTRTVKTDLEDCQEAELAYLTNLQEMEYVFSHSLIKDVTYDSILRKRRMGIHEEIGSVLEKSSSDRVDEVSALLAYHFEQAGNRPKTCRYSVIAGKKAKSEYRNQDAMDHLTTAIRIIEEDEGGGDRLAECLGMLANVQDTIGDYDSAIANYRRSIDLFSDQTSAYESAMSIADILFTRGELDEALGLLDEFDRRLDGNVPEHRAVSARSSCFRAWVHTVKGNLEEAVETVSPAIETAESFYDESDVSSARRLGHAYNTIATVHWAKGEYGRAREYYLKALDLAQTNGFKREVAVTHGNIGLVLAKMGKYDEAIDSYSKQLKLSEDIGDKLVALSARGDLATAYILTGHYEKATDLVRSYKELAEQLPSLHDVLLALTNIALIHLARGEFAAATERAEEVLARSEGTAYERERASQSYTLGLVALKRERFEEAETLLDKARSRAEELQDTGLLLKTLLALARAKASRRRNREAQSLLRKAEELTTENSPPTALTGIRHGYAVLYAAEGDFQRSEHAFRNTMERLEKLGARPELEALMQDYRVMLLSRGEPDDTGKAEELMSRIEELRDEMGLPPEAPVRSGRR